MAHGLRPFPNAARALVVALLLVLVGLGIQRGLAPGLDPSARGSEEQVPGAELSASLEGRARASRPLEPTSPVPPTWTAWVLVTVGYSDEPVASALVRITAADGRLHEARTAVDGTVRVPALASGDAMAVVTAAGFSVSEDKTLQEPGSDRFPNRFPLDRQRVLRGRVLDAEDGRAIPGARVVACEGGAVCINPYPPQKLGRTYGEALADARGEFAVAGVPAEPFCSLNLLRAEAPGRRTCWFVARGTPGHDFTLALPAGASLDGHVLDAQGRPVPGAQVLAVLDPDPTGSLDPWGARDFIDLPDRYFNSFVERSSAAPDLEDAWVPLAVTADAEGRYVLGGLGLGERYAVYAMHPAHAPSAPERGLVLRRSATRPALDLRLRPQSKVRVRCLDERGLPWPALSVRACEVPGYHRDSYGTTGADGTTEFVVVPAVSYEARFQHPATGEWQREAVTTAPGVREILFRLRGSPSAKPDSAPLPPEIVRRHIEDRQRPPSLVARLALPVGASPPAYVSLSSRSDSSSTSSGTAWQPDASGTTPLEWRETANRYRFTIKATGFLPIVREVETQAGESVDLGVLQLDPGVSLLGRLVTPDGQPLADADVSVSFSLKPDAPAPSAGGFPRVDREGFEFAHGSRTDGDGSFQVLGLARGNVRVRVQDGRCLPLDVALEVPAPHPARIVVPFGSVVVVHVVDEQGDPVPRCHVQVRGPHSKEQRLNWWAWETGATDVFGRFTGRTQPGRIEIGVGRLPDGGSAAKRFLDAVEEGERREIRITLDP